VVDEIRDEERDRLAARDPPEVFEPDAEVRRARRRLEAEVAGLNREVDGLRRERADLVPTRKEPEPAPPLIMPPVA